jgi:membrane protein implicated in regulation of membrane protease activity
MSGTEAAVAWLATGLALLVLEVVAPGAFMMWLGIAAVGTGGIVLAFDPAFAHQVVAFAVLAVVAIAVGVALRRSARQPRINTPDAGLLGRTATVLRFDGTEGRVRVGDSDWPARLAPDAAPGAAPPEAGARLRVVGVDGTVLVVGSGT